MKLTVFGANKIEIQAGQDAVFFSYETPVAARIGGAFYITEKKWSQTTTKHITQWLDTMYRETPPFIKPQKWFDALLNVKVRNGKG